jgi:hypothetical protein
MLWSSNISPSSGKKLHLQFLVVPEETSRCPYRAFGRH